MVGNETFFESLSVVGWLGIALWVGFFVAVLIRREWFTSYEDRFPKLSYFNEFIYEEWHEWLFLAIRFILMVVILFLITKLMFSV